MDREKELLHFKEISEEISQAYQELDKMTELEQEKVKELRSYINDQYESMDVKELRSNVEDAGNMALMAQADAKRLRNLKFLMQSPYFAKLSFVPDEVGKNLDIYIGTGGFWSEKDGCAKIYDWRAPVSSLYYDFEPGRASYRVTDTTGPSPSVEEYSGEITEKCQFTVKDGKMLYMAESAERIGDELLLKALSGNAPEKMRPVIATIQKEQNSIIRDSVSRELVVDGRAGSGKTVIAMHRLAWLLYSKRKTMNSGNVLILSPNSVFSDYISDVMPELMESSVPEKQWDDLMEELIMTDAEHENRTEQSERILESGKKSSVIDNIRLKTSIAFFDAFEAYIDKAFVEETKFKDFHYEKVTFSKEKLEKYFFGSFSSLPAYERYYNIAYFIVDEYVEAGGRNFGEGRKEKIRRQLQRQLIERFSETDLVKIYADFLSVVAKAYPGAEIFTDDDGKICYEDMQAIFYLQIKLYGCNAYRELKHCIIDEMQDYSVFQFAVMKMIFGGSKTLLGDRFQVLVQNGDENVLDAIIRIFPDRTLKILNKTYRSTEEISDFCNSILGEECHAAAYARHGTAPETAVCADKEEQIKLLKTRINDLKNTDYESIAIICNEESDAYELFRNLNDPDIRFLSERNAGYRGGIAVMSSFLAKGMEFDAVCVVTDNGLEPEKMSQLERSAYYISCTRALHELYVYGISG